jgi:vacuolar-type H+-ATPase subunit H
MAETQQGSATAIEEVVSELHRRGVERGELEFERLVAEARKEAAAIVSAAESRRDSLIEEARREADRLVAAGNAEAEQLLHAFNGSIGDIFRRRASGVLGALAQRSFSHDRNADTLHQVFDAINERKIERLRSWLDSADPQSFLEALLILAIVFYSDSEGFAHFQIDADLQARLGQIVADPGVEPEVGFEFRNGIVGFRVSAKDGREIEVSEESLRHMAQIWVGDEFREVLVRMLAEEPLPGTMRDA